MTSVSTTSGLPSSTAFPSAPHVSGSLYVGDLAPEVTEHVLAEVFSAVGPVVSTRVCRDSTTRRSLGYAYVNFHRHEDAERALDTMNFTPIASKPCRIMWSQRDPSVRKSNKGNVHINHLDKSIDNKTLYDTFSLFGNIMSCKVVTDAKGVSRGYGFVHFESEESAKLAIDKINGKPIANKNVVVSLFKPKQERGANSLKFTNVYIKFLSEGDTKESVEALMKQFGPITSSMVPMTEDQKSRGFAFVNFSNAGSAIAAVQGLHDQERLGQKLYVARAMKKAEREMQLKKRQQQIRMENQRKFAAVNLFIKNLADVVDDERLREEFTKFGTVTSVKVMRDSSDKSRGFGFVCFENPEDATKAITQMNGFMVESKPLYVALHQPKDIRRAHLESQFAAKMKMGYPMYGPQPPMFYPTPGFPQMQAIPGRWNQSQMPHMMSQVPGMANGNMRMGVNPNRNGPRAPRPQGINKTQPNSLPNQMKRIPHVPGMPLSNFKYNPNVRNTREGVSTNPRGADTRSHMQPVAATTPTTTKTATLTVENLTKANPQMQKRMIGERLFPLIANQHPNLAPKITGMLLEMDNTELLNLLESTDSLTEKINEALGVLREHESQAPTAEIEG